MLLNMLSCSCFVLAFTGSSLSSNGILLILCSLSDLLANVHCADSNLSLSTSAVNSTTRVFSSVT